MWCWTNALSHSVRGNPLCWVKQGTLKIWYWSMPLQKVLPFQACVWVIWFVLTGSCHSGYKDSFPSGTFLRLRRRRELSVQDRRIICSRRYGMWKRSGFFWRKACGRLGSAPFPGRPIFSCFTVRGISTGNCWSREF